MVAWSQETRSLKYKEIEDMDDEEMEFECTKKFPPKSQERMEEKESSLTPLEKG